MVKRTLTPPPSSLQELQDQLRGKSMQCDNPTRSTYFERTCQTVAQLALQSKLHELIQAGEQADLASNEDPNGPNRLFITASLVLAYLIVDDLPPARHALIRLPESLMSIPFYVALRNLTTACWQRAYEQVYSNAVGLNDVLSQAEFFDKDLANVLNHLLLTFIECFRRRTSLLLLEAYSSVPLQLAEAYLGMSREEVLAVAEKEQWEYDVTSGVLNGGLSGKLVPAARTPGASTSSLSTFHYVSDSVSRLEL
ncbi:hypothetical protein APHAL10511_001083 [Amanita phalloides]|nr:hypothetical protein APHAL10511_001083 [Amanita phalloides]